MTYSLLKKVKKTYKNVIFPDDRNSMLFTPFYPQFTYIVSMHEGNIGILGVNFYHLPAFP